MNHDGVRLTGGQQRRLAIIAMLVAAGLALVVGGIAYGLPPQAPSAPRAFQVVVSGRGSAAVAVSGGDGEQRTEVELPYTVPVDGEVVQVEARSSGGGRITCTVLDASGTTLREARGTSVRCSTT